VVFPHCLDPKIKTAGNCFANLSSTEIDARGIIVDNIEFEFLFCKTSLLHPPLDSGGYRRGKG
jgi:hypothetical protein